VALIKAGTYIGKQNPDFSALSSLYYVDVPIRFTSNSIEYHTWGASVSYGCCVYYAGSGSFVYAYRNEDTNEPGFTPWMGSDKYRIINVLEDTEVEDKYYNVIAGVYDLPEPEPEEPEEESLVIKAGTYVCVEEPSSAWTSLRMNFASNGNEYIELEAYPSWGVFISYRFGDTGRDSVYCRDDGYTFTGWADEAYRTIEVLEDTEETNVNDYNWFVANYIPKPSASATFDLSTLNLPAGTHTITVKARASGYADSAESAAVSYVVESANLIIFTLAKWDGTFIASLQAEEGMTWEQWVVSKYNTVGIFTDTSGSQMGEVFYPTGEYNAPLMISGSGGIPIFASDQIMPNTEYQHD
jgi:hypothetical protein